MKSLDKPLHLVSLLQLFKNFELVCGFDVIQLHVERAMVPTNVLDHGSDSNCNRSGFESQWGYETASRPMEKEQRILPF